MQIVSCDGEFLFENPVVLSPDSVHSLFPQSVACLDEGAFVSWLERLDSDRWLLKLQRVDSQGNLIWDEGGQVFREFNFERKPSIVLLADSESGLLIKYDLDYLSPEVLYAVDENGNLRDGWPENGIESDSTRFGEVLPDSEGGFWIANLDLTLNRLSGQGEWIWEENVNLTEIFREDFSWYHQFKTTGDYLYCLNSENHGGNHTIAFFDLDGEVVDSNWILHVEEWNEEEWLFQEATWFVDSENRVYVLYGNFISFEHFFNQDGMPWIKCYDPFERDHYPWGWEGIQLPEPQRGPDINWNSFDITKLNDVLLFLGDGKLFGVTSEGESAWEENPRQHNGYGWFGRFLSNDGECWVSVSGRPHSGYVRLNEDGDVVSGDERITILPIKRSISIPYLPLISAERLSILFYDGIRGLIGQTVNIQGDVSEPLTGTVIESEWDYSIKPWQVGTVGDHHWIWQELDDDHGILRFLNADWELIGSQDLPVIFSENSYRTIVMADDGNNRLLLKEWVQEGDDVLTMVNINGEIVATDSINASGKNLGLSWYWEGNGWITAASHQDTTAIYLLDDDLQPIWDEPPTVNYYIRDAYFIEDEFTVVGYLRLIADGPLLALWDTFTCDGELLESFTALVIEEDIRRYAYVRTQFASNGKTWFRYYHNDEYKIQLIATDGRRFFGDNGIPISTTSYLVSDTDGDWIFWRGDDEKAKYIHIDEDGNLWNDEFTFEGLNLFECETSQTPYHAVINPENGTVWVVCRSSFKLCDNSNDRQPDYYIGDYRVQLVGDGDLDVKPNNAAPAAFQIFPCYPNPFNLTTVINYVLPATSQVSLSIYNIIGQRVEMLVNGKLKAGFHRTTFSAEDMASGLYFVRLEASGRTISRKILLVK